jgi:hypothetical protein
MEGKPKKLLQAEWACRILLTIHLFCVAGALIVFWQTKYQLVSPLIPKGTVEQITGPYWTASLVVAASYLAALWFYFFRKRTATIILSAASVLAYPLLVEAFAQ